MLNFVLKLLLVIVINNIILMKFDLVVNVQTMIMIFIADMVILSILGMFLDAPKKEKENE